MQINELSSIDSLSSGDLLVVFDSSNSDSRKASLSALLSFISDNTTSTSIPQFETQYSAPSATGFSVQITDGSDNIHLILTPLAGYAAGTIVYPDSDNVVDKQRILVNCTQSVTTLTTNGNGATVTGAPTTLSANSYFEMVYDLQTNAWYRVG